MSNTVLFRTAEATGVYLLIVYRHPSSLTTQVLRFTFVRDRGCSLRETDFVLPVSVSDDDAVILSLRRSTGELRFATLIPRRRPPAKGPEAADDKTA